MGYTQLSGSEVMGLVGSLLSARTKCRLSGNKLPDRLRHSFSHYMDTVYHVRPKKSNVSASKNCVILNTFLYNIYKSLEFLIFC